LFPQVLNTVHPYKGGWQAIQLAGTAQGDNPDTQYRLSQGTCLGMKDVMLCVAINHSKYGICLYNNINIIDLNKSYSFNSVTLNYTTDDDLYIVIAGRDPYYISKTQVALNSMFEKERQKYQKLKKAKIGFYPIVIPTGTTDEDGVPLCHQILMVERIYINLTYASLTKTSHNYTYTYALENIFGQSMKELYDIDDQDAWDSLVNVTAPKVQTLLPPSFIKFSYTNRRKTILTTSIILLVLLLVAMWLWRYQHKMKRM
jgi:hypothetical protein